MSSRFVMLCAAPDIAPKVFDLKAVNPSAIPEINDRTTMEVIDSIQPQGTIVEEAMSNLKRMMPTKPAEVTVQ